MTNAKHSINIGLSALACAVLIVLTLFSGVLHGRMSNRWGQASRLAEAGNLLLGLPAEIGDWQQVGDSQQLSGEAAAALECSGYVIRNYIHRDTRESVTVGLIVGPAGPMSVHTPEVCYSSREFPMIAGPERQVLKTPDGVQHEFWRTTHKAVRLEGTALLVYYGWNDGSRWTAAEHPRFTYAGKPYLYKLQLAVPAPLAASPDYEDAGLRFLRDLLPVAKHHMLNSEQR